MLSPFNEYIKRLDLFGQKDRILLAVSGGLDSMVMLHLFLKAGYDIGVAHANFGLRGEESDGDEAFVQSVCTKNKIPFYKHRFPTKNYAEEKNLSIQMAARELRYEWFNKLLVEHKFHWLATAHHLNDNLETVLLRWIHGAGLDQLTGIPVKNDRVVRPLLFATRAEIRSFAERNTISWQEDSSNAGIDYPRNFVRHQLIPKMKEMNPSVERTFATTTDKLQGALEQMRRGLEQLKDSITRTEGRNFLIDKNVLSVLKNPAFVLYEWLKDFGFDWDRCTQLAAALDQQPGKLFQSTTHEAVLDRESVIVSPREQTFQEILIEEGQDLAALGPWMLTIRKEKKGSINTEPSFAAVDQSKMKFPLLWRRWKRGDTFVPLGMKGRKKVSDFLVDEKVPLPEKSRVTVVESSGEIVWVAGYRVDERFKITSTTDHTLVMHIGLT